MTPEDARAYFERGRRAKHELELLRAHRERICSGLPYGGTPATGSLGAISDPTGRAASVLVDMSEAWERDEAQLLLVIDDCRVLCEGVGRALGAETQIVLESRYLMAMRWGAVAQCVHRSLASTYAIARTACEYVAYVGIAAAREGLGRAAE